MDEVDKIKVWKDEAAVNGYIIKDEVKVKDLEKLFKHQATAEEATKNFNKDFKKIIEKKEEIEDMDFVRYEEHDDIDYKKHLKKFFKGEK